MDDDRTGTEPGTDVEPDSPARTRRGLMGSIKSGIQGTFVAGMVVISIPVGIGWAGGGTAGAVVAGMEKDWFSLGLSIVIPGYGAYYTVKTLAFDSESSAIVDQLRNFVVLTNAGPTFDQDCVAHGGKPAANVLDLQAMESKVLAVDGMEYPVLTEGNSVYVLYAWPTDDPPRMAIGACRFSDE